MERRKPGPPPRGNRRLAAYRLPVDLLNALAELAAARHMTVTDLVGETLAREAGIPYLDQEALPLREAS